MALRVVTAWKMLNSRIALQVRTLASGGDLGSGSGKGGGSGGSVRDAGGAFGKLEAAREEEFFHRKNMEQLKKLRAMQADVTVQIRAIEAIEGHTEAIPDMDKSPEEKENEKRYFGVE